MAQTRQGAWTALCVLACAGLPAAAADEVPAAGAPAAPEATTLLGTPPVQPSTLALARGGAEVLNDMKLGGVVTGNQAVNVTTGANLISDGALAGAAGMPMVVQNSGNNVLIQSATIVNVQLK